MNIAIVLFIFSNALQAKAYDYDYDYDYDYWDYDFCNDDWYLTCDGDFCTDKAEYIDIETEVPIPNTNFKKLDYDYFAVLTNSALKECSPSLGIRDFAYCAKSCQNISSDSVNVWDYKEACTFLKKGWINSDGTINEDVKTRYNEISGMYENINKCFLNSEKKKARSRNMKKSMKGNPKVKRKERKSSTREKSSKKFKKGGKKAKNNHRRSKQRRKGITKGRRGQSKRRPRRDTNGKKDKGKDKKKKKKQQKAEGKRLLKSLELSALPSSDIIKKLECLDDKIRDGLYSCIENILKKNAGNEQ